MRYLCFSSYKVMASSFSDFELQFSNMNQDPQDLFEFLLLRQPSSELLEGRDQRFFVDDKPREIEEKIDNTLNFVQKRQSSTGLHSREDLFLDNQPSEKPLEPQKNNFSKATTKNILINFKNFFIDYIKEHHSGAESDEFIRKFSCAKKINRSDYEQLFKKKEYQEVITQMFHERYLQRQIQLSRSEFKVRALYVKKIAVFRKAFEMKWFPKLN